MSDSNIDVKRLMDAWTVCEDPLGQVTDANRKKPLNFVAPTVKQPARPQQTTTAPPKPVPPTNPPRQTPRPTLKANPTRDELVTFLDKAHLSKEARLALLAFKRYRHENSPFGRQLWDAWESLARQISIGSTYQDQLTQVQRLLAMPPAMEVALRRPAKRQFPITFILSDRPVLMAIGLLLVIQIALMVVASQFGYWVRGNVLIAIGGDLLFLWWYWSHQAPIERDYSPFKDTEVVVGGIERLGTPQTVQRLTTMMRVEERKPVPDVVKMVNFQMLPSQSTSEVHYWVNYTYERGGYEDQVKARQRKPQWGLLILVLASVAWTMVGWVFSID